MLKVKNTENWMGYHRGGRKLTCVYAREATTRKLKNQLLSSPVPEMSQAINFYFTRAAKPFANTTSLSEKSVFQDFILAKV